MEAGQFRRAVAVLSTRQAFVLLLAIRDGDWHLASRAAVSAGVHLSTATTHFSILHAAGVLERRRVRTSRGQSYEYRLPRPSISLTLDVPLPAGTESAGARASAEKMEATSQGARGSGPVKVASGKAQKAASALSNRRAIAVLSAIRDGGWYIASHAAATARLHVSTTGKHLARLHEGGILEIRLVRTPTGHTYAYRLPSPSIALALDLFEVAETLAREVFQEPAKSAPKETPLPAELAARAPAPPQIGTVPGPRGAEPATIASERGVVDDLRTEEAGWIRTGTIPEGPTPVRGEEPASRVLKRVEARLRQDPRDADALFVKAAALARSEALADAIATLETLSTVDEAYPGLWILKGKLHARQREWGRVQECIDRSREVQKRQEQLIAWEVAARQVLQEAGRAKGLTNGLNETKFGRERARLSGLTNGVRGRTNGLVNGRGRTNWMMEGTSRVNGIINGRGRVNGRVNGLVNGSGRINGMGRVNGLIFSFAAARRNLAFGLTNGLTNGSGLTNGLGSMHVGEEASHGRWRLYVIPLLAALLLTVSFLGGTELSGSAYPIAIDGDLGDWDVAALAPQSHRIDGNPNIDITRFGIAHNADFLAFAVEVNGTALRGGDSPPTLDVVRIFLDVDRDASTGYRIEGLGADNLLEVAGWRGTVNATASYVWNGYSDPLDWRGWALTGAIQAATSGPRIELQVHWPALNDNKGPVLARVHAQGFDGSWDTTDYTLPSQGPSVVVRQEPIVSETITVPNEQLLRLEIAAFGAEARLTGVTVTLMGSAPYSAVSKLRLTEDNGSLLDERVPVDRRVPFQFPERRLPAGAFQRFLVIAEARGTSGDTLGALVAGASDIGAPDAAVTVHRLPAVRDVGYVGAIPAIPRIDGGFAEWTSTTSDPSGDVAGAPVPNVDLAAFAVQSNGGASFFFTQVQGRLLAGTWVVERNGLAPSFETGIPDTDRDRVPDEVDPRPADFDNDGTPDGLEGGDVDSDGLVDYGRPGGTDWWLNTTIPANFPAPYGGRQVRVYIGPVESPYRSPEDILRVFVDLDNDTATGYAIEDLGADRLLEVSGAMGRVERAGLFAFDGGSPGQWSWRYESDVSYALGYERMEFASVENLIPTGARLYVEIGEALGSRDSLDEATRGTRGLPAQPPASSFDVAPSPLRAVAAPTARPDARGPTTRSGPLPPDARSAPNPPMVLDIPGNQGYWLRDTSHATETACTTNKVASTTQGAGPVKTLTLNAGQDACWYLDATTGTTIPAGSWESLLDVSRTDEIGAIGYKSTTGSGGNFPKQLDWTGSAWGTPETELATASAAVENVRVIWDTATDSTLFWILVNTGTNIHAYKCTNVDSCTKEDVDPSSGNDYAVTQAVGSAPERHWDAAIEASSGELLLLYDNPAAVANDLCYRTRGAGSSGTWSAETCMDNTAVATTNPSFAYITLANNPGSNRIAAGAFDTTNDDFILQVWDGTAWVNANKAASTAVTLTNGWGGTVLAEDASDEFVAYAGNGADSMAECEWTSAGGWEATCATFDPNTAAGNDLRIMSARPLGGTDKGMVCQGDDLADDTCWRWTGVSGLGGSRGTIQVLTTNDGSGVPIALNGATLTGTLGDTGGNSVTLASWTPAPNDLILVVVAMRATTIVPSISGNGLTWTTTADVTNAQTQMRLFMFQAQGASPSTGSIVVTVTGNTLPVTVQAQRFSGVDTTTPVEATATNAGPPSTDNDDMLHSVTTITANAWAVAGGTHRLATFAVPGGETPININLAAGTAGDTTTTSLWYEGPIATPASTQLGALNDLSSVRDWAMIVVSLKPAPPDMRSGFDWNPDQSGTSDGLVVFYDNTVGSLSYNTYDDATDGWGTAATFTSAGSHKWVGVYGTRGAGNTNKVFVVTSNSNFDILAYRWSGSGAPANEQSITADTVNENYLYWDMAFAQNPSIQYDVRIEIWNKATDAVDQTIGTCLDATTYGDDVQCLISGVGQTTLTSNQVVRIRVAHSSAFSSIKIDYDDADTTGDSRVTLPIPEFATIAIPIGGVLVIIAVARRWFPQRRRFGARLRLSDADAVTVPHPDRGNPRGVALRETPPFGRRPPGHSP